MSYLPSEPVSRLTDFWSLSNSTVISVKIFSIATNQTLPSYCNSLYHQSSAKNKCIDSFFPGWTWTPSCFSHFLRISALPILDQEIRTLFSLSIKVVDTKYLCILYIKLENQYPMDRYKISGQTLLFQDIPGQKRSKKLSIKI